MLRMEVCKLQSTSAKKHGSWIRNSMAHVCMYVLLIDILKNVFEPSIILLQDGVLSAGGTGGRQQVCDAGYVCTVYMYVHNYVHVHTHV